MIRFNVLMVLMISTVECQYPKSFMKIDSFILKLLLLTYYSAKTIMTFGIMNLTLPQSCYMGLEARKPVFGGLRTTKMQASLHIHAV